MSRKEPCTEGPPGGKQRRHQRAQRTEGVGPRATSLTYDEHLDRSQLAHLYIQIEALIDVSDGVVNMLPDLCIRQAGNVDFPYLGQIDRAGAVHSELGIEIDLAPDANHQLVPRSENVVGSDIHLSQRSEGRRNQAKQAIPINRKKSAQRAANQKLEVCRSGRCSDCQQPRLLQRFQLSDARCSGRLGRGCSGLCCSFPRIAVLGTGPPWSQPLPPTPAPPLLETFWDRPAGQGPERGLPLH